MATGITIATGPLTASRTYQNDAAAQEILLRFATYIGAEGTNAQRLQAIVDWCVRRIQEGAALQQMAEELETTRAAIREGNVMA